MEIHLSTATIRAVENRRRSMNLHFNPIVLFANSWPFPSNHLQNICWSVSAEPIGTHIFEFCNSEYSPLLIQENKNYMEFHLRKNNVPFQYNNFECQITFSAIMNSPHSSPIKIEHVFWGIVKAIWSKGLN